ncbi:MAG: hypothetical protein M0T70_00230 [Geobacteraceae bacterium]|nr:hypothetical protein [Geobacteraceae bacterium]
MEKYRIAYIDESPEDIRIFQRYASDDFEVIEFDPPQELENLIEQILGSNVRAIVSDYNLTEYKNVAHYDGVDVVTAFLAIKPGFPTFVLTSYDEDAANESSDVNLVYTKEALVENQGIPFKERIRKQIDHYLKKINDTKKELQELLAKQLREKLTSREEERLVDLDAFLENSINAECALPRDLKLPSNADKLNEILMSTKQLLEEIKDCKK